jgi:hypothetical protein
MYLRLDGQMSHKLADFLNTKKGEKLVYLRQPYTTRDMARDLGINETTLGRLMSYKISVEGLDLDTFGALYRGFGDEFLEVLGMDTKAIPTFLPAEREKNDA